ncbi:molybdopterin molybdenumtransferase MoeA [Actinoplanes philippinensis]|uniref:Molybdopterin molybdenumtransferase n=1 Tax=Actinoplanes philippinensis TaxID=35752 RepID=A0A1I2EDT4_9ACTN|nr:molybdopterin molybdotransferase MoeA [Actinoplanes philippinensis]GIE77067.1 molybdopterin molybdenumtransferase MoeA [Actinoplanes philippinensis]SFE91015.1 molybdopterin molybdotransferase [Actinoplanes philippinensis]
MSWADAYAVARDTAKPLAAELTRVVEATGRVLAAAVRCERPVPAFDNAAMDGFAIAGDGPWTVRGRVLAGRPADGGRLLPGTAVEIATGALLPDGAEAVLPYEDCRVEDDLVIEVAATEDRPDGRPAGDQTGPRRKRHIRRAGDALSPGTLIAPAGRIVTATVAAAALQAGAEQVLAHRRPTVTMLVTGDEVITEGSPGPGQVRDTFTGLVTAITARAGGRLDISRRLPDDPAALGEALHGACSDVIVVSGSSSAGAADHLHRLLDEAAATWLVRGVACRPGHPQALAVLPDGRHVVSLPGNPYAGLVAALTLLEPLVAALAGRPPAPLPTATVTGPVRLMAGGVRIVPIGPAGDLAAAGPVGLHAAAVAGALAVLPDDWTDGDPAVTLTVP